MRIGRPLVVAMILAAGFAACDLNPQPLPPGTEDKAQNDGDSGPTAAASPPPRLDSGSGNGGDTDAGVDGGQPVPGIDGGDDSGDSGDGGDGGGL